MALQNVTHYVELNFTPTYKSSIFTDDKLSDGASRLLAPVWRAEKAMRLEIVNRINTLLYDRREQLAFCFTKDLKVFWRYRSYVVTGVQCSVYNYNKELRKLTVFIRNGNESFGIDPMYALGVNELVKLYEMVVRTLCPRDDRPDMLQ